MTAPSLVRFPVLLFLALKISLHFFDLRFQNLVFILCLNDLFTRFLLQALVLFTDFPVLVLFIFAFLRDWYMQSRCGFAISWVSIVLIEVQSVLV